MSSDSLAPALSRWELAAEMIAVKIRWFGVFVGYLHVNTAVSECQSRLNEGTTFTVRLPLADAQT